MILVDDSSGSIDIVELDQGADQEGGRAGLPHKGIDLRFLVEQTVHSVCHVCRIDWTVSADLHDKQDLALSCRVSGRTRANQLGKTLTPILDMAGDSTYLPQVRADEVHTPVVATMT